MIEIGREVRDILENIRIFKELAEENARFAEESARRTERINELMKKVFGEDRSI